MAKLPPHLIVLQDFLKEIWGSELQSATTQVPTVQDKLNKKIIALRSEGIITGKSTSPTTKAFLETVKTDIQKEVEAEIEEKAKQTFFNKLVQMSKMEISPVNDILQVLQPDHMKEFTVYAKKHGLTPKSTEVAYTSACGSSSSSSSRCDEPPVRYKPKSTVSSCDSGSSSVSSRC
jgi:hypothetical protein